MLRKIIIAVCSLAMAAAALAVPSVPPVKAQSDSGLSLITEFIVPGSRFVKFPQVVAGRGQAHVSGNAERSAAFVWSKSASATAFGSPFKLADASANGLPDWSATSVALGPDGSLYAVWIDSPARSVNLRIRNPQGAWGPTRVVDRGARFPYPVQVAVTTSNQIFVSWRDTDRPIRFRVSTDGGANWSNQRDVSDLVAYNSPHAMGAGPNGAMAVTFTAGADNNLHVFVGVWNGGSFDVRRVSPSGGDYAESTVSWGPDGKLYAAWRGVAESGGRAGAFFSERQADGSWPTSRLIGGRITGTVSINADEVGNLHMSWVGAPSGGTTVWYAFKPAGAAFRGPIGSSDTGALFNARGYGSVADATFNHTVSEEFNGGTVFTRYSLFSSNAVAFGGEPLIADGAVTAAPAADGTVKVTFRALAGNPNQIRWRWNAAPSDTATDSNGWQALSAEMRIPVPEAIRNDTSCRPSTLFTQMRNTTTGVVEPQARTDAVNIDGIVEAAAFLDNPFLRATSEEIAGKASLAAIQGAPGGAPNYTRVPLTWLNIFSDTDCSGIPIAGVGPSADKIEQNFLINDGSFQGLIPLPNLISLKPGPVPFVVRVVDGAGNARIYNLQIILDETKPELKGGTITARPSPDGDIIQELTFSNIQVADTQYPTGFWGMWIANAPEPVTDPLNDPSLKWTVVEAPDERDSGNGFVIDDWSLATGLSREARVRGEDYFIYVRFLDGAGNPTDGFITVPVPVSNLEQPRIELPIVRR